MNIPDEAVESAGRLVSLGAARMVASQELGIAFGAAAVALGDFAATWQSGIDADLAEHPDLAELNVMLDGFYGESGAWG